MLKRRVAAEACSGRQRLVGGCGRGGSGGGRGQQQGRRAAASLIKIL